MSPLARNRLDHTGVRRLVARLATMPWPEAMPPPEALPRLAAMPRPEADEFDDADDTALPPPSLAAPLLAAPLLALPKRPRGCTARELYAAILDVLRSAARLQHFTSLTLPCWDGWATSSMIAWRLDQRVSNALYAESDPEAGDREAWYYVDMVLQAASRAGRLQTRLVCPLRFSEHEDVARFHCQAYRLPGDVGYCRWHPERPRGPIPGEPYDDPALMDSRQVRLIRAEMAAMGCQLPPFLLARFEQYAQNKSGLRALR